MYESVGHEVIIGGHGTRGRLEGCDMSRGPYGVYIFDGSDPLLVACKCVLADGRTLRLIATFDRVIYLTHFDFLLSPTIHPPFNPFLCPPRIHDSVCAGVTVAGNGTKGRLEGC